jgi:predicted dehydrogenase
MPKVRWGQLSTADIGLKKVLPGMMKSELCEIVGISSRDLTSAETAARALNIPKAYGSYQELLEDPDIQAVYNPLPNHLHVPWSIKALEAGKHVLCEKPIAMTADEAQTLVDAAARFPHLKIMEAFMYRHHPQWKLAKQLVDEGNIGDLRTIHSHFSYFNDDPNNIRNMADIGGGGLMDIGCYNISLSRFIFAKEPSRAVGIVERDPKLKTDRLVSGILDFESGTSTFTCSTQLTPYQRVNIFGTMGRIEIQIPFNAPPDRPCIMWHEHAGQIEEIKLPTTDQYGAQGDAMSLAILNDTPVPTPLTDAVANMRVIEAILESARDIGWVSLNAPSPL